ncbi:hypothetical protein MKQ70_25970 [Chitinophaga sedimenti]|uniref:hypothetical protein n=1 Tax=Chitinophaga sedimenti TaxID=2033606 RepID=UPI0020053C96|nr:hypothetical protein [Chitinophaga sedimenti]MCK7558261.1 hypothetical protein [Chitinophaga sedimenti]
MSVFVCQIHAQSRTDKFLDSLLRANASPLLMRVLDHPDSFQCQLIYTRIDRNAVNLPAFRQFYLTWMRTAISIPHLP